MRYIVLVALAPLLGLLACGDSGPVEIIAPTSSAPATVTVVPPTATLAALDQTLQLNTTVLDQSGQAMPGVSVSWTSSGESVATVDAAGLVTATGNGTTSITAAVTGADVSGRAEITVAQQPREIALSPEQESLRALGDTVRLTARVRDANGHGVEGVVVDWVSSDPSVVSVDDSGLVTAIGEGNASVLATSGPAEGSADFSVEQQVAVVQLSPAPDTLRALGSTFQLMAIGVDANGHMTGATAFVWASADESVAIVNDVGLVTAAGDGSTDVTAALPDGSASASVGVTVAQRVQTVRIAETGDTVRVGRQYQLSAEAYDGNRHPVAAATLEWSSNDEAVATVDRNGLLSAKDTGSVEITVTVVGSDATATVTLLVQAPPSERDILVEFYQATDGPNWERNLYWLTDFPLSVWDGVTTEHRDSLVVTGLFLKSNNLAGKMPSRLGSLANLEYLNLSFNELTGPIPPALSDLAGLRVLELNSNHLTGPVPAELGSLAALEYLWFEFNNLTGPIPPELGNLGHAIAVSLWKNNLTGPIPPELGNLAGVRILDLADNELTGSIPLEFTNLGRLESLNLSQNNLTGSISELGSLKSLKSLLLSGNDLSGSIPPELGNLEGLGRPVCYSRPPHGVCTRNGLLLHDNNLTGPIPPELGNLKSLLWLFLYSNNLTGSIPPELGNLESLQDLRMGGNRLTGSIPPELGNLDSLQALSMDGNRLTGSIPPELGGLDNLTSLGLAANELTGSIPPELGNLRNLQLLLLNNNNLTGSIPPELGELPRLRSMWLTGNNLTGSIPPELGSLGNLQVLSLRDNNLTGSLPPELGDLDRLTALQIDGNGLTGAIPQEFTNLKLGEFSWHGTQLCAPANEVFQTWLRSIPLQKGGSTCSSAGGP